MSTIVALGGGGFSMEDDNIYLDAFIFGLAQKERPKVCFVGTASGDAQSYSEKFLNAMEKHDVVANELLLYRPPVARDELEKYVLDQDVIYVGGGNTFNLMTLWKAWGLDEIFKKAHDQGVLLAGISAGSICWFDGGVSDSFSPPGSDLLDAVEGIGLIAGSNCPHYDGEAYRRDQYHRLLKNGSLKDGIAAENGVALVYKKGRLAEVVSSSEEKFAYKIVVENGIVHEEKIRARFLG